MQFADPAAREAHVYAGNRFGDGEIKLRDLARPAAVLDASRGVVKRGPEHRRIAHIRCRRRKRARKLLRESRVAGPRVCGARRVSLRVDRALWRLVGIAERRGTGRGGDGEGAPRRGRSQHVTAR